MSLNLEETMYVRLTLLVTLLLYSNNLKAQGIETVGSAQYFFSGNTWRYFEPSSNRFWPIDSVINIEYQASISDSTIYEIETENNLRLAGRHSSRHRSYFCSFSQIFNRTRSLAAAVGIESATICVPGYSHLLPNDPLYYVSPVYSQWHLPNIEANGAWDYTTGDPNIIVAIPDAGSDWGHEDLGITPSSPYGNIWLNEITPGVPFSGEDPWTNPNNPSSGNGLDDDLNGIVDDWKGANFGDPSPVTAMPTNDSRPVNNDKHGTAIAGIIGAKTNNNVGMAGIAGGWNNPGVQMMILKVNPSNSSSYNPVVQAAAINYAINKGADIINISAGGAANK